MKKLILLTTLIVTALACTQEVEKQKDLLTLSGDLNQCLSQNKGPCCDIYNQLIDEAMFYGISVDNSLTCK